MRTKTTFILLAAFAAIAAPGAIAAPASQPAGKAKPPVASKAPAAAVPNIQQFTYHVIGLFDRERENDLRTALAEVPGVSLVSIDFNTAEATFSFDPKAAFPTTKPEKIAERFDQMLRPASGNMISVKPVSTTSKEKLKQIELPVVFVECRACALAIHEMLMKQEGVEQALVNFKEHKTIVTIDPEKTSAEALEAFLKKREVKVQH